MQSNNWEPTVKVPLTLSVADRCVEPATFDTTQVYSPACLSFTDSIDNCLDLFPDLEIKKSPWSGSMGLPLNIQTISRGRSPLMAEQASDGVSPALIGSSPKEKGKSCGATETRKGILTQKKNVNKSKLD